MESSVKSANANTITSPPKEKDKLKKSIYVSLLKIADKQKGLPVHKHLIRLLQKLKQS